MEKPDPQIAEMVRELRDKLEQGKAARIPWSLYEDVIASRGLKPETFEHSAQLCSRPPQAQKWKGGVSTLLGAPLLPSVSRWWSPLGTGSFQRNRSA